MEVNLKKTHIKKDGLFNIFKFSLSSFVSFIIDYSLFTIFSFSIESIILCNIFARIISSLCNYLMNKKIVFKSNNSIYKSLLSYYILAIVILSFNTILLHIFVDIFFINKYYSKIIVEGISYFFSYFIQKKIIFKDAEFK